MPVPGQHRSQAEREDFKRRVRAGEVPTHVGRALGLSAGTITTWTREARAEEAAEAKPVRFPSFIEGDDEETIEEILSRQRRSFERKSRAAASRKWFPITISERLPYGILWFGDPHIDDGGCNWPLLEKHLAIARLPGVYGANVGDTTNNWPWTGRLARLWAESEVSDRTAKRMAEWFMFDSGVRWLLWLIGNHDEWNGGADFYKRLGVEFVPVIDWRAQFVLRHTTGTEVKVDAAHGRKGSSIYNPGHSTLRAAKFGEDADLYVTGHIHSFNLTEFEDAERQRKSWLAQVRGYKWGDHHALVNGFAEYQHGASIMSIVDPRTGSVHCYSDPEFGADVLAFLRSR